MKAHIQKWGNSLAVRLPSSFLKELNLQQGQDIEITINKGSIKISPLTTTLDNLLDQVSEDNLHTVFLDSEDNKGRELW